MDVSPSVPSPGCPECARLRERVAQIEGLVAQTEAKVATLRGRLGNHTGNSSIPPSANPSHAPTPAPRPESRRKRGGQLGPRGHSRGRIPIGQVTSDVDHIPDACSCCRAQLPAEPRPGAPEQTWHLVIEIPPIVVEVVGHRGRARSSDACGTVTRRPIPPDVAAHVVGTWLTASLSYLVGRHHLRRRGVRELLGSIGAQLSLGTIAALEREVAAALTTPHAAAGEHVRRAGARNADETGWKLAGAIRWLGALATATVAYFAIHAHRGRDGFGAATGGASEGHLTSDRWGGVPVVADGAAAGLLGPPDPRLHLGPV